MAVRMVVVFRPPVAWRGTVDMELEITGQRGGDAVDTPPETSTILERREMLGAAPR